MRWWTRSKELLLTDPSAHERPLNLSRWFALLAALSIGLVSISVASLLSTLFRERMLGHDGRLTASYVDSISRVEPPEALFAAPVGPNAAGHYPEFFAHVAALEDALRINAYSPAGVVIWSTDPALTGKHFGENKELDEALKGRLVVHTGLAETHPKPEHMALKSPSGPFVENYIPVWSTDRARVIGVIEVYRVPALLFDSIETGRRLTWAGAALAAAVLFIVLWSAVRRAERILIRQREQLLESQTLATVGELSRAVAHSVRNPLAAIRSSAELELQSPAAPNDARGASMKEIVGLVDRIDQLLTDMLSYSAPGGVDPPVTVDIGGVVGRSVDAYAQEFKRNRIDVSVTLPSVLPPVSGDERLLTQALASVLSNAVEAMPDGGRIEVDGALADDGRSVRISVRDTGIGMDPDQLRRAFDPFYTSKARGLGIGLALVRRIVERSRGRVALKSETGRGTTVMFTFQAATGGRA
jgi:two-component system, NtrC family, sensor histidine kinase HydH